MGIAGSQTSRKDVERNAFDRDIETYVQRSSVIYIQSLFYVFRAVIRIEIGPSIVYEYIHLSVATCDTFCEGLDVFAVINL